MKQIEIKETKKWALVTGGSSGIGFEFASQLAEKGYNLVIASRDGEKLSVAAEKLKTKFRVEVEILRVDLTIQNDIEKLKNRIENTYNPIEILVNDAGFALHDSLLARDDSRQIAAFSVMAETVLQLSGTAARVMKSRGHGQIINVGSTSAWLFAGNYSALKRWVVVYTESLALELKDSGVSATVVCPGWVKTNFHRSGGVSRPKVPSWVWMRAETVVKSALRAAAKGKSRVIPTLRWKLVIFAARHCEPAVRFVSRRMVKKRIEELQSSK